MRGKSSASVSAGDRAVAYGSQGSVGSSPEGSERRDVSSTYRALVAARRCDTALKDKTGDA